jgi:ankyrin repeat protein
MAMQKLVIGVVGLAATVLPLVGFEGSPLADAAENRDFAAVRSLVAKRADVNAAQRDGNTALDWAVHWGDANVVDLLLKAGADTKTATRLNATALYLAAESGNPIMVQKLLAAGADPNQAVLSQGETPLMFAARSGNVESVRILLDKGAKIEATEKLRSSTALLWAAEQNHPEVVKVLLDRGAKADAKTSIAAAAAGRGGRRGAAAPAAAKGGTSEAAATPTAPVAVGDAVLIAKAAPAAAPKAKATTVEDDDEAFARPPAGGNGGITALILATREGGLESMKVLLDAGAPINQQSANGNTALIVAAMNGNAETINYLLERGADVNLANGQGWTPLYLTVKARTMEKGTMPNPKIDEDGLYKAIVFMLDHGVNVNARIRGNTEVHNGIAATWLRESGATAFLRASFCADLPVMKLLLAHGADPNIATTDNTTALMALSGVGYADGFTHDFGTEQESLEAMQILIDRGAVVNATNADGVTALHGAAHKNFLAGINYLVSKGADLSIRSHRETQYERKGGPGNTALDWATGIQIGMQSAIYHEEAVALISKLMTDHGLEAVGLSRTKGGNAKKQ